MIKYRISKFAPKYRNNYGEYLRDDWTSYSDIGKIYDNKGFEVGEFTDIVSKYINTIIRILIKENVHTLVINRLEQFFSIGELNQLLHKKGISLSDKEKLFLKQIHVGSLLDIDGIKMIISLVLKECLWCELESKNRAILEFGYDLYVYITCGKIDESIVAQAEDTGIYIERYS